MNSKLLVATAAIGLAFSGPAFADPHGGSIDITKTVDITKNTDNSFHSTIGNVSLDFSPSYSSTKTVDVTKVIADQELNATNTNSGMSAVVNIDEDNGYTSGGNSVNNAAFAAFAGILNQSWNTGINANTQSANNLAVQGNTHFNNQ